MYLHFDFKYTDRSNFDFKVKFALIKFVGSSEFNLYPIKMYMHIFSVPILIIILNAARKTAGEFSGLLVGTSGKGTLKV